MNGGGAERERETQNPKQALGCQHRARRGAQTHGLQDRDLSQSRLLNRLSHPGAPPLVSSFHHGIRELSLGANVLFSYHLLLLMFHQLLTTWHFGTNKSKHKWTHGTEIVLLGDHTDDLELHCPI